MIVGYQCKDTHPDSICAGREYQFWVYEGDDGTFAWGPRDDAWFRCGFPSRQAAVEEAEDYYMTIAGEDLQLESGGE